MSNNRNLCCVGNGVGIKHGNGISVLRNGTERCGKGDKTRNCGNGDKARKRG
jgi:hypothetical protein